LYGLHQHVELPKTSWPSTTSAARASNRPSPPRELLKSRRRGETANADHRDAAGKLSQTDIRGFQGNRIGELGSMGPRRTEGSVILLRGSRMLLYRPKKITTLGINTHRRRGAVSRSARR
jgi:hypothetical protein